VSGEAREEQERQLKIADPSQAAHRVFSKREVLQISRKILPSFGAP